MLTFSACILWLDLVEPDPPKAVFSVKSDNDHISHVYLLASSTRLTNTLPSPARHTAPFGRAPSACVVSLRPWPDDAQDLAHFGLL